MSASVSHHEALKAQGNKLFAEGKTVEAIEVYDEALQLGEVSPDWRCTVLCNRAACYLKLGDAKRCATDCTEALELDGGRAKAFYRRAKARMSLGELEAAFKDATRCVQLNATNKDAVDLARDLKARLTKDLEGKGAWKSPAGKLARQILDQRNLEAAFRQAAALAVTDDSAEFWRSGACGVAASKCILGDAAATKFLSACCLADSMVDLTQLEVLRDPKFLATDLLAKDPVGLVVVAAKIADKVNDVISSEENFVVVDEGPSIEDFVAKITGEALRHPREKTKEGGLDVVAKWLGPIMMENKKDEKEARRRRNAARLGKYSLTDDHDMMWTGLWSLLGSDQHRKKAQGAIARIVRGIAASNATDLEYDDTKGADVGPRDLLEKLVDVGSEAPNDDEDGVVSRELGERRRIASLVVAYSLASSTLGAKALRRCFKTPVEVMQLISTKDPLAATLGAEVLAGASSCDEGRSFLEPLVATGSLEAMMGDDTMPSSARSAAATAVTRLGLAAKALKAGSSETGHLLMAAVQLCKEDSDARDRGLEILASLSSNSAVKEEIAHGSNRVTSKCLEIICSLHNDDAAKKGDAAYGIATILSNVTVTNNELRQRYFREKDMDITPEQYDELMRVTKQKQADDADNDTEALAASRRRKVVMADGAAVLARMTTPSANTAPKIAETLANLAKESELRGTLIQQGAFKAAIALAGPNYSDVCRGNAAHAVAKILVTTDPRNLTDSQALAAVRPLLWLCKQISFFEFMHFEACLALTNLLSLGADAKRRVVNDKGISTLEYLQFSPNPMLQRAATEALTNMVPDPDFIAHLKKTDKLKLWVALAQEYDPNSSEEDDEQKVKESLALARAACGCLAMASGGDDEDLCELMAKEPATPKAIQYLLGLEEPSLVHRTAVLVRNLAEDPKSRPLLLERIPNLAAVLRRAREVTFPNVPLVATPLDDALAAVENPPPDVVPP